jgi:rRNA biogenesis protein RRP5
MSRSLKDFGCIVRFYNQVQGVVPKHELSTQKIEKPQALFKVGQPIQCQVIFCKPNEEKMTLSFVVTLLE